MVQANGFTLVGRQVLLTMAATDTAAVVSIREAPGSNVILTKNYGYIRIERAFAQDGNRLVEWEGRPIWGGGVFVFTPRNSQAGGTLTQVVAFWKFGGLPWLCFTA